MASPKTAGPLPPCDCLNYCGDDPWLYKGQAEPCEAIKRQRQQHEQRESERRALVERLIALAALADGPDKTVLNQAAQLLGRHPL